MCWLVLVSFGRGKNTNAMYVFFNRWFVKHVVPDINASTIATSRNAKKCHDCTYPSWWEKFHFWFKFVFMYFFFQQNIELNCDLINLTNNTGKFVSNKIAVSNLTKSKLMYKCLRTIFYFLKLHKTRYTEWHF